MSSEAYVDVQDAAAPTKHMRTKQATISGTPVQSEVVVLSTDGQDSYDARLVQGNLGQLAQKANNANPATTDIAIEVKLTSIGTLLLTQLTGLPINPITGAVIGASQSGAWTVDLLNKVLTGNPAPGTVYPIGVGKDVNGNLQYLPLVAGIDYTNPVPVVLDISQTSVNGTLPVSGTT